MASKCNIIVDGKTVSRTYCKPGNTRKVRAIEYYGRESVVGVSAIQYEVI